MQDRRLDFSNISIITHIRIDGNDRIENLKLRNHVFDKLCKNLEFVNVEDDVKRKLPIMGDEIYHLTDNGGPYNKNLSYNIGFRLTDRPYVLFLDADCIIDPNIIKNIVNKKSEILDTHVVYPFEYVLYLKEHVKKEFKQNPTIEQLILKTNIPKHKDNTNEHGRLFLNSCGGAILTNRKVFTEVNGFNPNFKGWGYEDSEFRDRLKIIEKPPSRATNIFMYHLPHGNHFTDRYTHTRNASHNRNEYNKVCDMDKDQCLDYMKTWTL